MAVHRPQGDGARGGDQVSFSHSLENYGGGTALQAAVTRWCTTLTAAVYTKRVGATPFSAALGQGQVGTALGVAVPPDTVVVPHPNSFL